MAGRTLALTADQKLCGHCLLLCLCHKTLCPSGQGDGLEIHWALPAGVRIPSVSLAVSARRLACLHAQIMRRPSQEVMQVFVKLIMLQACWSTRLYAALCWGPWPCAGSLTCLQIYAHAAILNRKCPCRAQRTHGNSAFGVASDLVGWVSRTREGGKNAPADPVRRPPTFDETSGRPTTSATYKHVLHVKLEAYTLTPNSVAACKH